MKRRLIPVLVVLLLILVVGAAGIVTHMIRKYTPTKEVMDPAEYYGEVQDSELLVMIDTELLEERGRLVNDRAYLPLSVAQSLNPRFYWDEESQSVLYCTTEEVLAKEGSVDGAGEVLLEPVATSSLEQYTVYVAADWIGEYTDLESQLLTEPGRLVIQKTFTDYPAVQTTKEAPIRYQGGIKSPILTTAPSGTKLRTMEEFENWIEVATPDGYIGYVEREDVEDLGQVSEERTFAEETFDPIHMDEKVNLVWHQVTSKEANQTLQDSIKKMTGVNVISPTWFSIKDNEGGLTSLADADYVNQAHAAGLKVWGLIDNFSEDIQTEEVLSKRSARKAIIEGLIKDAVACGMDGINVDFESMSEEAIPHYLEFMRELAIETHSNNLVLSADNPVPEGYTVYYNRAEQGRVVDYLIIMGYDEHYLGDTEAGSVASLPWVEQGIIDTLSEVPSEKVINAIPFYTRVWKTSAGVVTSEAVGMDDAKKFIKKYKVDTYWDKTTSQNYGSVDVKNDTYEVWLEDAESIAEKMKLISQYDLAGVAWKLGFENNGIWEVISEGLAGTDTEE